MDLWRHAARAAPADLDLTHDQIGAAPAAPGNGLPSHPFRDARQTGKISSRKPFFGVPQWFPNRFLNQPKRHD